MCLTPILVYIVLVCDLSQAAYSGDLERSAELVASRYYSQSNNELSVMSSSKEVTIRKYAVMTVRVNVYVRTITYIVRQ